MDAASVTPGKTRGSNAPQNIKTGNPPDSTQKPGPKLSTRTTHDLMLDNSTSNDARSNASEDDSSLADRLSKASGNDTDHFPKAAEKTQAVKPNSTSQRYVASEHTIP